MSPIAVNELIVFLVAAGLIVPVVKQLKVSPVLGFLVIGLVVGPYGLGRLAEDMTWLSAWVIEDIEAVRMIAEVGVILLLFMIGLELSLERLVAMRRLVFGMGSAQIGFCGILIGVSAWLFGNSVEASILLGASLALSSTAVVMQLLIEKGQFGTPHGRGSFAILLAQDIAVVPILFLVGTFGAQRAGPIGLELALAIGEAALAVIVILGVGRLLIRPLFRFVGATNSPELFMATTLLAIVGTAWSTHHAGLSAALGAFLVGLLLAESEYRHEIEVSIDPFKGLFLGVFFMSVGMGIDFAQLGREYARILLAVVGLLFIKSSATALAARLFGFSWRQALRMGLELSQGGEFAFIVIGAALAYAIIPTDTAQFMLIVVSISMLAHPFVSKVAQTIDERLATPDEEEPDEVIDDELSDHVVIVGFGRIGQMAASLLDQQQVAWVAIDLNVTRVQQYQRQGKPVIRGDVRRAALLERIRLRHAAALMICTDDPGATEAILAVVKQYAPSLPIIVRAKDNRHASELLGLGANHVTPELSEAGLQLTEATFRALGYPAQASRELIDTERVGIQYALDQQAEKAAQAELETA